MTWQTELNSWLSPPSVQTAETPTVGQKAPSTPKLNIPAKDGKPTIISFLRHCGCPFAEKTFLNMRDMAAAHRDVDWVAVSHSEQGATERWLAALPEPAKNTQPNLHVIVDAEREVTLWPYKEAIQDVTLTRCTLGIWRMGLGHIVLVARSR